MSTIHARIKEQRLKMGYTLAQIADMLNVKEATVQRYESGEIKNLKHDTIVNLANILRCSPAYLMGWETHSDQVGTPYNPIIHKIPILGYISAGLPLYADEHIEGYTYTEHNGGAEYFALRVKGDSMSAAQINDGNIIIVRKQECVENGEIAVVRVNNDNATVKRFRQDGNVVQLIPQSFNPEHNIQFYDLKDTAIDVIGKVVECKIEF